MTRRRWWYDRLRSVVLMALVLAVAIPTRLAGAADTATAMAIQGQLPQGYTVTYAQTADIGGDGQMQAIFKAELSREQSPLLIEIVGIAAQAGGNWTILRQSMPYTDSGTAANIYVYPKNGQHPGFVITDQHICGANCNGGEYALMVYDGGKFTTVLSGVNDRGNLTADPDTGAVAMLGPIYTHANPRCCPDYNYTRTWTWQGTRLMPGSLTFASGSETTVPAWFTADGARLVMSLGPFISGQTLNGPLDPHAIAPMLADRVQIKDAANNDCVASRDAVAAALARGLIPGSAVWPAMDGYSVALSWWNSGLPDGVMADGCVLDAGNGGGYVMHLTPTATGLVGDRFYATPQVVMNTPDDAIQIPPM